MKSAATSQRCEEWDDTVDSLPKKMYRAPSTAIANVSVPRGSWLGQPGLIVVVCVFIEFIIIKYHFFTVCMKKRSLKKPPQLQWDFGGIFQARTVKCAVVSADEDTATFSSVKLRQQTLVRVWWRAREKKKKTAFQRCADSKWIECETQPDLFSWQLTQNFGNSFRLFAVQRWHEACWTGGPGDRRRPK